ncbi:RAMP superfamily CRISPR-associated protein [Phormidesmis sp. 146-33]
MIRGLKQVAQQLGFEVEQNSQKNLARSQTSAQEVPMMYRAQVEGRCSLQFAGNNQDLSRWEEEWVDPINLKSWQPRYQHSQPQLGEVGKVYRFQVDFPFRLFSNCGQDSIHRPVMGKNGIPFLPGSSVKGLFRRACLRSDRQNNRSPAESKVRLYCGDADQPGSLRFHGAYPSGNWANRMVDVVHPQQERQVQGTGSATALALISFYQPEMVFEFSSQKSDVDWKEVKWLLLAALQLGVGGKTSTGYGLGGNFPGMPPITPSCFMSVELKAVGVSSLLRTDVPEFRPNLFKASLRGHVRRLLAGVCGTKEVVQKEADRLFGHTGQPGVVQLLWQSRQESYDTQGKNPTYATEGFLHLDVPSGDREFLQQVLRFGFVMGGFGKSWRRVWHDRFFPDYRKFAIGCHWESPDIEGIRSSQALTSFLDELYRLCRGKFGSKSALSWKESWNPERVAVFSKVVSESVAIRLFHDEVFKTTPAIGGKIPGDKRPTSVSSVWHRMLPIEGDRFLEVVTVFHGDRDAWKREGEDQLQPFIQALQERGLVLTWGNLPKLKHVLGGGVGRFGKG